MNLDELVDENFQGPCIVKLYHAYVGSTKSITFSVEEIFVQEISTAESYFSNSDSETDEYINPCGLIYMSFQREIDRENWKWGFQ